MSRAERNAQIQIYRKLKQQGYVTYANLFAQFELRFANSAGGFAASTDVNKGVIYLNPTINNFDAISTLIRHEILHNFLKHQVRVMRAFAKRTGLDYDALDDLSLNQIKKAIYSNDKFNIAGDYEISNRGYTDKDKEIVRNLGKYGDIYDKYVAMYGNGINVEDIKGLVTEDDHPDWVDDSIEDMYNKLLDEMEEANRKAKEEADKNAIHGDISDDMSSFIDDDGNVWDIKSFEELRKAYDSKE